jgi:hypothetical protein
MIRNLKVLGLALVAMFAMAAVLASVASAQTKGDLTSDGRFTLKGKEAGTETENRLTAFGKFVQCPGSTYTGHKVEVTPHVPLTSGDTTATVTPHYKQENCRGTLSTRATVHMNGCDYVVHLGETTGGVNGTYGVTFDVVCPVGKEITETVWTSGQTTHPETNRLCIIHVPGQNGLAGAHATNLAGGKLRLSGTVEKITASQTKGPDDVFNLCPNENTTTAKFDLNAEIEGVNELGETTQVEITH